MFTHIRPAIVMMVLFTALLGLGYPLAMTEVAGSLFPDQAAGSLVHDASGRVVGSSLIAQGFTRPEYFHPRPSAAGMGYDPMNSGGSNLGPLDQKLIDRVKGDAATLRKENPGAPLPADALTTSASGLDPDITPENAAFQAPRVAKARGLPLATVTTIIDTHVEQPFLGVFGQPTVNVLALNRALDDRSPIGQSKGR